MSGGAGPSISRKRKADAMSSDANSVDAFPVQDFDDDDDVREPIPQKRETLIQVKKNIKKVKIKITNVSYVTTLLGVIDIV